MKRKLTVTITQSRRQVTTLPAAAISRHRCPVCEREVATLSQAQAAELLTVTGRRLEDLMASSRAHTVETVGDGLRVCKDSLFAV